MRQILNTKMKTIIIYFTFSFSIILAQDFASEKFANFLFNEGEYYRAITEYYKILHVSTDSENKISALKNIGKCYITGKNYENYIAFFYSNRSKFFAQPKVYSEMNLYLGISYYYLNSYSKAISVLNRIEFSSNNPLSDDKFFFLGISNALLYDWNSAFENLKYIKRNNEFLKVKDYLLSNKQNILDFKKKNPTLAGIMSGIIPGAGYIYSGKPFTGVTSFIVNVLLFWAFYDAMYNSQYGLSASIGFFGLGWYVGNIIGSANATRSYNKHYQNKYVDEILKNTIN